MTDHLLDAALEYAARGWPVFPLDGKEPRTSSGVKDATTDENQIRQWWTAHPSANIGLATGRASAVVIDDDGPLSKPVIAEYARSHGIETAEADLSTPRAKTAKGEHLYFGWSEGCEKLKNWTKIIPDTDIRTTGGYVVVPPSFHPDTGAPYEWIVSPENGNLRPFPGWLIDLLLDAKSKKRAETLEKITTTANMQKVARMKADEGNPYGRAALEGELSTLRATGQGERNNQLNESAIKLFGLVKGGVLDQGEVERELSRAARSVGLTDSEITKTLNSAWSGATAREVPDDGPKTDETEARELLETLVDNVKEDPSKIEDPDAKRALLWLREHDRIKFGLLVKNLPVGRRDLDKGLDQLAARLEDEKTEAEEPPDEPDEEIRAEAARIIAEGRSFEHIYKVWQKRHLGDARAGKILIISTGAQSCSNTAGINVILNGPRGCGKSDILQKAAALLPQKHLLFGDMSPQAIYYFAQEMPDGAVVAFDDITFNDTYAAVQKRCTTRFQEGAEHRVVLERGPWTFKTKPRISFWCTSVDRQFDEQLQDRYFAVNIEDSLEHKAEVIEFMKARDAGIDRESEERETRICRAIIRDLKDHLFEVVVPFADRITLLPGVGERGYRIISDMIKSFCAFRYAVRETDDHGRLVANEEDFEYAKALFDDAEGHGEEKYTEAEKKVLRGLINCAYVATLENLSDATKLSSGRLKDILNGRGRDEQKRYGLLAKCPVLTVERVSETVYFEPEPGNPKSKTTTHNEYRLDRNFSLSEVYNSLVYLEPKNDNGGEVDVVRRRLDVALDVVTTDSRGEVDVDDVIEERERENTSDTSRGGTSGEKLNSSPKTPVTTSTTPKEALDSDCEGVNHYVKPTSGVRRPTSGQSIAEGLEEGEARKAEYLEHVKTPDPAERSAPKKDDIPDEIRAEVLEIVAGLNGKAVTFGNIEAYLETRSGEYAPPKAVHRVLKVLASMGGTTDKNGVLTLPEEVVA